jgi:hypothetical protein
MHQRSIVEAVRGIAPVIAELVKRGVSEGVYHTPYPLETMEFLPASNQFFFDDAVFLWKPGELATRVCAKVNADALPALPRPLDNHLKMY